MLCYTFKQFCLPFLFQTDTTLKSAYKESAYKKELQVITNLFLFPNLYQETTLPYIFKELRL